MRGIKIIGIISLLLFLTSCKGIEKLKFSDASSAVGGTKMNTAIFETNMGTFKIELLTGKMPITTKNFIDLTQKGFYDGTKFHRVISNFMIQGGDPLSKDNSKKDYWGTGDPGYKIKDEFADGLSNVRGTLAMANAGPNTGGSQFFINTVDNTYLDPKHPVFGKVIEGMEIIDRIEEVATNSRDCPLDDVVVKTVSIK